MPPELVFASRNLRREMIGVEPPAGIYAHIAGIDLVRYDDGRYYVPEAYDPEHGEHGESHSWVDVHLGEAGWLSLDPTHDVEQSEHYVRVGVGRDYADVPPPAGSTRALRQTLEVAVTIREP